MERLLLLWDELDDWAGIGRHWLASAASELAPVASAGLALALWFIVPQSHVNAAVLGLTATLWGSYRKVLRP
jgi:hypothetical protein